MANTVVRLGFLPLVDSAIVIAAAAQGFAEEQKLTLELTRETSWASLRDRLVLGHVDAAPLLAPMALAAAAGLDAWRVPLAAPMTMGLNGNSITVSAALFNEMRGAAPDADLSDPLAAGAALRHVVRQRQAGDAPIVRLRTVFPFSSHSLQLRHWLRASGLDPAKDVDIEVIPPPLMVDALAAGYVDGFCAGAPWSEVAADQGVGRRLFACTALWPDGPEKVLAMRATWLAEHHAVTLRLVKALVNAARWCADPRNHPALAQLLAQPQHVGQPAAIIAEALASSGIRFFAGAATHPRTSQALWLAAHMLAGGDLKPGFSVRDVAAVYRPDVYRAADPSEDALARADTQLEGQGVFDGQVFDPAAPDSYVAALRQTKFNL
jgi:two-component system, oxyanion-binding sensor